MDPISQAALGAAVGHAFFYKQLGYRAAGWGALAGLFPDVDTFYGAMEGPYGSLLSHRGITHALWFGPVFGSLVGWWFWRRDRLRHRIDGPDPPPLWAWIGLFVCALVSHPLLDTFTHYGTQLLAPFSSHRFAIPAVPVVAPVYTFLLLGALIVARFADQWSRVRWITGIALVLSTGYLVFGWVTNDRAVREARSQLVAAGIENAEVHAFPTMLQLPYRRLVALTPDEVRVGFVSMWYPCPIEWAVAARVDDPLVDQVRQTEEGEIFAWFASDMLVARILPFDEGKQVQISDLRYGFEPDATIGMWGIEARFDNAGNMAGPPVRFRNRPEVNRTNIRKLLNDAFPQYCGA